MVRPLTSTCGLSMLTPFSPAATFYEAGLGACGISNTDADFIVAIDAQTFDTFPGAGANPNASVPRPLRLPRPEPDADPALRF